MKARPWRQRMLARNRKLRRALRVLAKKAWSGLDRNYAAKALKLAPLLVLLGCVTPDKPCQVERICNEHNADVQQMLKEHPATMMDILQTIAILENETGHYK